MPETHLAAGPAVTVAVKERSPDRVVLYAGSPETRPEELPTLLSRAVDQWAERHPERRIRSTLGIVAGGNTVAVHLWYDGRLAPPGRL